MRRSTRMRQPAVKPVEHIELNTQNKGRRMIAAVLFLILAAAAFAYGFYSLIDGGSGWQEVSANSTDGPSSASDFTLMYNIGAGGTSASAEKKAITSLYTQAAWDSYRLFTPDAAYEDIENICSINEKPNRELTVDGLLYSALRTIEERGSRLLYLGPVYQAYDYIGTSTDDVYAAELDPWQSVEAAEYYGQIAAFAADPGSVQLELLGQGKVRLCVSEEYLAFAQENGISRFIDFGWMKNAFITDYIAGQLVENGYDRGVLSSHDGFSRALGEVSCSVPLLKLEDGMAVQKDILELDGPVSTVSLRAFPTGGTSALSFYSYRDGTMRTPYVCMDGKDRAAVGSLTAYSSVKSCGEILTELAPLYLAETLDTAALTALDGIDNVIP